MNIGEVLTAAANGKFVRRAGWAEGWHMRVFRPIDIPHGAGPTPTLRCAQGWPHAVYHYHPSLTAADLLAADWEIVAPEACIHADAPVAVIPMDEDD